MKFLVQTMITLLIASTASASKEILNALAPFKTDKWEMKLTKYKVRGDSAREMLKDYGQRVKGLEDGFKISLDLPRNEVPDPDDGNDVVALTKIVNVTHLIANPGSTNDMSESDLKKLEKEARDILFEVRDLGGRIGVESSSWGSCGVSYPGVIVLDTEENEVIAISPKNTDC